MSWPSAVRTIRPPVAGTRLTRTRTRTLAPDAHVLGVEQRRRACDRDGDRVALAQILDLELLADLRPVGRQVRHHEVFADRRPGARRRRVRPPALLIHERRAVEGEDRLTTERITLHTARRRRRS